MKCTDLLIKEHKIILRALYILENMAIRVENDQPIEPEDVDAMLHFLRAFGDDYHQAKEESALFPELRRSSHEQEGSLRHMLFEHDQERSLIEALQEASYTKNNIDFVYFANRLTALLRNHIQKEDSILFDIVERSLSAEQDDKVVAEFNKFQIDPGFLAKLRRLEWTYVRRRAA